jgi:hypothetical protein
MKFSKAKRKLAPLGLNIRKEGSGWIVFELKSRKDRGEVFKTQAEALAHAKHLTRKSV